MTKFYLIIPCVLLLVFVVFQRDFQKRRTEEEKARALQVVLKQAAADRERAALKDKVAEETRQRTEQRERQEREKTEKKNREAVAALQGVETEADRLAGEADKLQHEAAMVEQQLAELRAKKQSTELETFELARRVEQRRIDRRSAEIEIQRTASMAAAKLLESPWASAPTPPTPTVR